MSKKLLVYSIMGLLGLITVLSYAPIAQADIHFSGDQDLSPHELPDTFTTANSYTQLYIDVTPHQGYRIQSKPQKYEITLEITVLVDGVINSIDLNIWLSSNDGAPVYDTNLFSKTPVLPDQTTFNGPVYEGDGWYNLSFDHISGYYSAGDTIGLEFYIVAPAYASTPVAKFRLLNNEDLPHEQILASMDTYQVIDAGIILWVETVPDENFVYPDQTPRTVVTPDGCVKLTLDVSPKTRYIPLGVQQPWEIVIEATVLKDGELNFFDFIVELHGGLHYETVEFDYDLELISETPLAHEPVWGNYMSGDEYWTEGMHTYNYLIGAIAQEGFFFSKGDTLCLKGVLTYPDEWRSYISQLPQENELLIKAKIRSRDSSGNKRVFYETDCFFNIRPTFVIPELPLGTLAALGSMITALYLRRKRSCAN